MTIRVTIRVKPGASRTRVGGDHAGALVVAVAQRAVDGKATEAALQALAEAVGVRRRDVTLVTGTAHRTKVVEIDGVGGAGDDGVGGRVAHLRALFGQS
jgi:uncharacterized protein YggU (UPF0235/DUF167 family)